MKITPILFVDAIEPSLEFWVGRLKFEKVAEVPEGNQLGFVILKKGDSEIMLQTRESIKKDANAASQATLAMTSCLYVEVDNFAQALDSIQGAEVLVPQRDTFYGMREIYVREPQGQIVGFAARIPQTAAKG
ncbi:MAG TPA: VOC family protein [Bryobacteraceae bacterium]|nr:VOC family protein [Bryobacteraceae bacterium]